MHAIRRLAKGMPGMLLATVMLFARLVAPAAAMPLAHADEVVELALETICHAGAPSEQTDDTGRSGHQDCVLCPACHLASHAVTPSPTAPAVPPPQTAYIGLAGVLPPATGPPTRVRPTAQPTGPPRLSA